MTEPFLDWALSRGAELGGEAVLHFGDPRREYHAGRSGVALFGRSDRGRLRISGTQALDFLHRTTTQNVKGLRPGSGAFSVIQTETARVLDWVAIWAREADVVMLTGPGRGEADREWIERLVIMDDVVVEDIGDRTTLFEIVGPGSPELAETLAGSGAGRLEPGAHRVFDWREIRGLIARGRAMPIPSFWILVGENDGLRAVRDLADAGLAVPAGGLADESIRIEMGQPLPGRELTEATNPLEAGLLDSVGSGKGCYIGQEVITRMITYKSIKRTLAGLVLDEPVTGPEPGRDFPLWPAGAIPAGTTQAGTTQAGTTPAGAMPAATLPTGTMPAGTPRQPIGRLTSAAFSYGVGRTAGLGIVDLETARPGTPVVVDTGGRPVTARIVALPMPVRQD